MSYKNDGFSGGVGLSRRRFVQGVALGGLFAGSGLVRDALAAVPQRIAPAELRGTQFDLTVAAQAVNFTGTPRVATTVNGSLPAPILRLREGDEIQLRVTNLLQHDTSIHWHGLILPSAMDGVPGISNGFSGIRPGETFTYAFPVVQSGTYWYHSHSGFQEQTGLYGPIVIEPREPEPFSYDRDHVVMLSDWTDEDPMAVYHKLKKLSHYYNFNERTHADLMQDIQSKGLDAALSDRGMWAQMRMSSRDLSDVTGYTYTYLMNGQAPAEGWKGLFKKGEKVRLRFINGSAMTFFDVRIPGLKMTVVAADGQYIEPVSVDEFRIGVAETYDVIVEPSSEQAYTIFAQDIARSGYARGTLTTDYAEMADVPELDPVADLSHADMGMSMSAHMGHGAGMDHSQHVMSDGSVMAGADHSQRQTVPSVVATDMSMDGMQIDDLSMAGMQLSSMESVLKPNPSDFKNKPTQHAETEFGPHVDMRSEDPQYRLDDPGVGLRNNGRRVLTYADLRNLRVTNMDKEPDRELELHLTGNMSRYMWSVNGVKFADAEPLRWKLGERVRITLVNDTMMNHPMHLHGMWSDLETGDNNYIPRKHTVIVQPGSRISYRVTVDAEGGWAYHCHLLYHMLGMFRTVVVS